MVQHIRDIGPGKLARKLGAASEGLRKPSEADRKYQDAEQANPEVGEGRHHDEDRRQDTVQDAAAAPGTHDPNQRPQGEGDDRRRADQTEGPGQRQHDDLADVLWIEPE